MDTARCPARIAPVSDEGEHRRHLSRSDDSAEPAREGAERRGGAWVVPAVLSLVALGAGTAALVLDDDPAAEAVGVDRVVTTPVLSARRVPEVIAAPLADRRLAADLQAWLASSPPTPAWWSRSRAAGPSPTTRPSR